MSLREHAATTRIIRASYFPVDVGDRVIRHVLRCASVSGILLVSSWTEVAGNFIAFCLSWMGLLALATKNSRAVSLGSRTVFWPGSRTERLLGGLTAVEALAVILLLALPFVVEVTVGQIAVAGTLLVVQNCILIGYETSLSNGRNGIERLLRDGGFSLLAPVVIASTLIPLHETAPTDTIVLSMCLVSVISSEFSFARTVTAFEPGYFIPGYLTHEVIRFGIKHAGFAFGGGLAASLVTGQPVAVSVAVGLAVGIGSLFMHGLMFHTRGLGRLGVAFLTLVLTSALGGVAAAILVHPPLTMPIMLAASLMLVAVPLFKLRSLTDERIITNC